jgi:hypothetical protein
MEADPQQQGKRKFLLLFSKRSAFLLYFTRGSFVDRASGSFLKKRTKKLS